MATRRLLAFGSSVLWGSAMAVDGGAGDEREGGNGLSSQREAENLRVPERVLEV